MVLWLHHGALNVSQPQWVWVALAQWGKRVPSDGQGSKRSPRYTVARWLRVVHRLTIVVCLRAKSAAEKLTSHIQ